MFKIGKDAIQRVSCSGLVSGSTYSCDNPLVAGIRKRVIIGEVSKIATLDYNVTDAGVLESILMASGERCFEFDGVKNSISPSIELKEGTLSNTYIHKLALSLFEVDSLHKANIQGMVSSELFAIIEYQNDSSLGNSVFEVYGLAGMEVNVLTRNPTDPDTAGAYVMEMQTPDAYGNEPKLPISLFLTNHETTLQVVEHLLTPQT